METIKFRLTGTTPLLMHNSRLCDPLDEHTQRLKRLTSIRKKTEENHKDMADIEFEGGLYFDPELGPYIPGEWLEATIIDGGKIQRNGTKIKQGVMVLDDKAKLNYDGPRGLEALRHSRTLRDMRSVVVGTGRLMRCRPKFPLGWSVDFTVSYNPDMINGDEVVSAISQAGAFRGMGDYRPRYGRFTVEVI